MVMTNYAQTLSIYQRKFKQLSDSVYLNAKNSEITKSATVESTRAGAVIGFEIKTGWARLIIASVNSQALCETSHAVKFFLASRGTGVASFSVVVFKADLGSGGLKPLMRVAKHRVVDSSGDAFTFKIPCSVIRKAIPNNSELVCFIALEFDCSTKVEIASASLDPMAQPDGSNIPYLESQHRLCIELAELNASIGSMARHQQERWLIWAADLAARLDCYETARRLIDRIEASTPTSNPTDRLRYLEIRSSVDLVTGNHARLLDLYKQDSDVFSRSEALTLAISSIIDPDNAAATSLRTLPSGGLNRFLLARSTSSRSYLGTLPKQIHQQGSGQSSLEDGLFVASRRHLDGPKAVANWLNRALRHFGLRQFKITETGSDNILSRLEFRTRNVSRRTLELRKVTVIFACYNSESTIAYALSSILKQDYKNLEILVCDDCSSDSTLSVIMSIAQTDSRIKVFSSEKNQGPYNIRNALISIASGDLITFADADDYSHPERVSRMVAAMDSAPQQVKLVMAKWLRIRPNGQVAFFRDNRAVRMCLISLLAPKALFEHRPYRSVLCGDDYQFLEDIRFTFGEDACLLMDEPLLFGLWSSGSLTQTASLEALEDGYRSPARLAYSEIAARRRLFGVSIVSDKDIEQIAVRHGIYRDPAGLRSLTTSPVETSIERLINPPTAEPQPHLASTPTLLPSSPNQVVSA